MLIKYFNQTLQEVSEQLQPLYRKIGLVFVGQILREIKRLPFYGLTLQKADTLIIFNED
jgi:hypothetical protein